MLSTELIEPWSQLQTQLEWSDGPWLGWIFASIVQRESLIAQSRMWLSPSTPNVDDIQIGLRRIEVNRPEQVEQALQALLSGLESKIRLTWVVCDGVDVAARQAWLSLHLLLNERRERLFRQQTGGVLFAASPNLLIVSQEGGPDLWTRRSLLLQVTTVARLLAPLDLGPEWPVGAVEEFHDISRITANLAEQERLGEPHRWLPLLGHLALSQFIHQDFTGAKVSSDQLMQALEMFSIHPPDDPRSQNWLIREAPRLKKLALMVRYEWLGVHADVEGQEKVLHQLLPLEPEETVMHAVLSGLLALLLFQRQATDALEVAHRAAKLLYDTAHEPGLNLFGSVFETRFRCYICIQLYEQLESRKNLDIAAIVADAAIIISKNPLFDTANDASSIRFVVTMMAAVAQYHLHSERSVVLLEQAEHIKSNLPNDPNLAFLFVLFCLLNIELHGIESGRLAALHNAVIAAHAIPSLTLNPNLKHATDMLIEIYQGRRQYQQRKRLLQALGRY